MSKEAMKLALEAAYLAGFNASGEGYNGENPFGDHARNPEEDAAWIKDRDNALRKTLAEQPAPMIRGDIRDGLVDDEPAHQHIEHCLWARNGNQPCPHVQPAQQEPVATGVDAELVERLASATPKQLDAWLTAARRHEARKMHRH